MASTTTTIKRYNSSGVFEDVKVWYYTSEGKVPVSSVKRWNGSIWEQVSKTPVTFEYNGTYTQSEVTISGVVYDLYTLTKSGTLTLGKEAKYWMCGGGGNGASGISTTTSGGGGGGGYVASGTIEAGTMVITVASANGNSKVGSITANKGTTATDKNGGAGGSGGGGGNYRSGNLGSGGSGAGVSTYPFGLTSLKLHCGGGGGGSVGLYSSGGRAGGAGASNGGSGIRPVATLTGSFPILGGAGGNYGGGSGGKVTDYKTANSGAGASFYGSGGGGGAIAQSTSSSGGSGYQGVVYIAIPKS